MTPLNPREKFWYQKKLSYLTERSSFSNSDVFSGAIGPTLILQSDLW